MNPTTPSRRFSFPSALRTAAAACTLFAAAAVPAQFQYDYGSPGIAEIGVAVTRMPTGYLVGGTQGVNPLGVLATWNGSQIFGVRHPPLFPGPTLTPNCVRRTATGGIIVSGEVTNSIGGLEAFLACYAPNGTLWPNGCLLPGKIYRYRADATGLRQGTRVVEMAGGGFAVIANVDPDAVSRGVLFTTGDDGCLACWTSYSYNGSPVRFHDLCQDGDGTFVIVGSIGDPVSPWRRTLLLRTTCGLAPIWAFAYSSPAWGEDVEQHAITTTAGGRFAVWGHYAPTSSVPGSFLYEFNGAGGVVWHTRFATIAGTRPTISRSANGDLVMNGRVGNDGLVLRTNSTGVAAVACTYGPAASVDEIFQVLATPDGGFVAAGSTQAVDTVFGDAWLVKADATGSSGPTCPWAPYPAPQSWLQMLPEMKVLQIASTPQMYYLYMGQYESTAPATEICSSPMPVVYVGNPIPTTVALPGVTPSRLPGPGAIDFRIDAAGLVPNGLSLFALSAALAPFPIDLSMLGGQPGSMLHGDPSAMATFAAWSNGFGEASVPFPIPNNPALTGLAMHWQVFDFDPALPFPLPLGNSQAMSLVIQ